MPNPAESPARAATRSIGQVMAMLRTEFPEISISKIRFLETEGLIRPQRAASGYRRSAKVTWSGCAMSYQCSVSITCH